MSKSKTKSKTKTKEKQSSVIRPGTGSGSRPTGGSTKTPMTHPTDDHKLGRAPAGALK